MTVQEQIDKIVKEYAMPEIHNKDVFRLNLELLVKIAEREQMVKDHGELIKSLKKKKKTKEKLVKCDKCGAKVPEFEIRTIAEQDYCDCCHSDIYDSWKATMLESEKKK